jgi:hypothetical protein
MQDAMASARVYKLFHHKQQEAAYDSPNDDVFRLVAALLAGSNIH